MSARVQINLAQKCEFHLLGNFDEGLSDFKMRLGSSHIESRRAIREASLDVMMGL